MSCVLMKSEMFRNSKPDPGVQSLSLLGFCSPIKDVAARIRHTTGSSFFKKNEPSGTHNFVYSFIKGAVEKPPAHDPWACLRNTQALAC